MWKNKLAEWDIVDKLEMVWVVGRGSCFDFRFSSRFSGFVCRGAWFVPILGTRRNVLLWKLETGQDDVVVYVFECMCMCVCVCVRQC